jgi:iron complex outermembrane receptor protein
LLFLGASWLQGAALRLEAQQPPADLAELDIERLMNIEVISSSKRQEPLFHAASAIFVITPSDIRRSGATNIPDLLRMVPGLIVAQVDASGWAISSRGFAERYANKLLVLVDGRTVYDPLFSGVYWDAQNLLLEDIERIEVIRGPGATLWGTNAVNGVISILTRSARDTTGGLISTTGGSREPVHINARYGARWGDNAAYRVYGSYFRRRHSVDAAGDPIHDSWEAGLGGFRADWSPSPVNAFTMQGEILSRRGDETLLLPKLTPPYQELSLSRQEHRSGNLLFRWDHRLRNGSDWTVQAYYDRVDRGTQALDEDLDTVDIEFQHHFKAAGRHEWVWGAGYRAIFEQFQGSFLFSVPADTEHRVSAFVQDEIALLPGRLRLVPGTKLEHAAHSGWNLQPSLRLLWTPRPSDAFWMAVSRALRAPSELESESRVNSAVIPGPGGQISLVSVFGDAEFKTEKLLAYELGYRLTPTRRISLDVAAFYNVYHDLQTTEPSAPFFESSPDPPHVVIAQRFDNGMRGQTYGVELGAGWNAASRWSLNAAYSRLEIQLRRDPASQNTSAELAEGTSPEHQFQFRSHLSLPRNLEWDVSLYVVSELQGIDVPAYARLDTQVTWSPHEFTSFSVGAQNLLSPHHLEFGNFRQVGVIGQAERNFFGQLRWRF